MQPDTQVLTQHFSLKLPRPNFSIPFHPEQPFFSPLPLGLHPSDLASVPASRPPILILIGHTTQENITNNPYLTHPSYMQSEQFSPHC